jgi:hypothetical protein
LKTSDFKNALPITVISFIALTKQWTILPVDAPNSILYGFPLPYSCTGWHTSMSRQFFILELVVDFLCYYAFWTLFFYFLRKLHIHIRPPKIVKYAVLAITVLLLSASLAAAFLFDNTFQVQRDFDFEVLGTAIKFF